MKGFITLQAPEVFHGEDVSVGVYGLEGSKPGAAAVGVMLSHRVCYFKSEISPLFIEIIIYNIHCHLGYWSGQTWLWQNFRSMPIRIKTILLHVDDSCGGI